MVFALFLFTGLYVIEGLGIERNHIQLLYFCLPAAISLFLLVKKKEIAFPKKTSIIFSLFILINLASLIFSVDKENTFIGIMFYISVFLLYIFSFTYKNVVKKNIGSFLVSTSILFTLYFLLTFVFPQLRLLQTNGYQLVRSYFGLHNHLGDYLGLLIIYLLYNNKLVYLIPIFPLFLLFYSRSSFTSMILTQVLYWRQNLQSFVKPTVLFFLVMIFWISALNLTKLPWLANTIKSVNQSEESKREDFFAGRLEYFNQIKLASLERPFLGFGQGNFSYISSKFRRLPSQWTETAHNIFLEELTSSGVLGLLALLYFIFLILKNADKKTVFFYLFIYLLINFQTDYTYKIYSILALFFILAGLVNEEKESLDKNLAKKLFLGVSLIILISAHQIIFSRIALSMGKSTESLLAFPLNKEALKKTSLGWYLKFYPYDTDAIKEQSIIFENKGDINKSLSLYRYAYEISRFDNLDLIGEIYKLVKINEGEDEAKLFAGKELESFKNVPNWGQTEEQKEHIRNFCDKYDPFLCDKYGFSRFKYFYEPKPGKLGKVLKQIPYPEEYTINKDTLNERYDYTITKPKDTFRIVVLGGSETFGLLVKTKDNWTEELEDMLNKNLSPNGKYKKIEVINLAVHGYDIPYQVERFRKRGIKYNPDLILWFINDGDFYKLNEVIFEKMGQINEKMKNSSELDKEIKKGNYYTIYKKSIEEMYKVITKAKIALKARAYLDLFKQYYSGPILIVGPTLKENNAQILNETISNEEMFIRPINNLNNSQFNHHEYEQINVLGHKTIAINIIKFLSINNLVH